MSDSQVKAPQLAARWGAGAEKERRGRPSNAIFLGLGVLFLVVLGIFGGGYFYFVYYERVAAEHLPEETTLALRIDLEQAVLLEPARRYVFPVLDTAACSIGVGRLARMRKILGIELAQDLREIVYVRGRRHSDWLFALGGVFPKKGLVDALYTTLKEEELGRECQLVASRLVCPRVVAEQAQDGVLLLASNAGLLKTALAPNRRFADLGLSLRGAGDFYLDIAELSAWVGVGGSQTQMKSLVGTLQLDQDVHIDLRVESGFVPGSAEELELASGLLSALKLMLANRGGADLAGERAVLERSSVRAVTGETHVQTRWRRKEISRAARSVAALLKLELQAAEQGGKVSQ